MIHINIDPYYKSTFGQVLPKSTPEGRGFAEPEISYDLVGPYWYLLISFRYYRVVMLRINVIFHVKKTSHLYKINKIYYILHVSSLFNR